MEYFALNSGLYPINHNIYYEKIIEANTSCNLRIGYVNSRSLPTILLCDVSNQQHMELAELVKFKFPMIPKVSLP